MGDKVETRTEWYVKAMVGKGKYSTLFSFDEFEQAERFARQFVVDVSRSDCVIVRRDITETERVV